MWIFFGFDPSFSFQKICFMDLNRKKKKSTRFDFDCVIKIRLRNPQPFLTLKLKVLIQQMFSVNSEVGLVRTPESDSR
jgi:hypothetical protein